MTDNGTPASSGQGRAEDLLYRVEVVNRGPETATIDVLPQLTPEHLVLTEGTPHR